MRELNAKEVLWAIGSCCALHRLPFDAQLVAGQLCPPLSAASLIETGRATGLEVVHRRMSLRKIGQLKGQTPLLFFRSTEGEPAIALVHSVSDSAITYFPAGESHPVTLTFGEVGKSYSGQALLIRARPEAANDPDAAAQKSFGFGWFVPELMKHRNVWRDVLGASLLLQLLALGLPLFTQAIIDKVVVHRTESTLIALCVGMAIFVVFTAIFTWVRQYLVLHTGNRIDAVLGASVFNHLFRLPPRYFQHRPTGVIAARLHGVETIREFVSSAAVTLILDIPFLLVAVAVMTWYSVPLTALAVGILLLIVVISAAVAPVFQRRLNDQFLLGARNQAFLTEYIAGFETVKSLQFEPQLKAKYGQYMATYLESGFRTKQIGNTYNVVASTLEQLMTLLILVCGAWIVMHPSADQPVFTIGMLVAFQMFAGKLSQPMMRMVGLWQQFQQSRLAVQRLGDLMNAPVEPYSLKPARQGAGQGRIEIDDVAFRYGDDRPFLYQNLSLTIEPGKTIAIMGPSGSGKSTLAKLLQGFYWPTQGQIRIDEVDIRHLSANELRANFGVVPQETVLFSGTIYDNLVMANPHASFEQVAQACRMAEIHGAIEALPQGYQTPIGERGAGLSGGQKQRLAIARALLKGPRVLVFDEATSALDSETAEHFAATINSLKGKVTMLFITHAIPKGLRLDSIVQISTNGATQLRPVLAEQHARAAE